TVASHTEQIKDQPAPTGLTGVAPTTSANTDGQITGVSTDMEFRLSGDSTYTPVTGTTITGLIPGTYYVRYAEKDGYNASPDTEVTVASHTEQIKDQPAPTGLTGVAPTTSGNTDGQITGTDWAMEYKLSADTNYTAVTGTVITGLAAGTYDVRYAAKDGYNASADVIVIVPGYTAAQPGFSGGGTTKTASDVQQETSGNTTTLTATTAGKSDALGKVTASVAASALNNMADSAADAEKQGKSSNVIISVNSSSDSASVTADMQRSAFDNIADKTNADVKVQTGLGSITFDSKAVDSISKTSSSGNVDVSIAVMDNSALSSSLQKAVGDRPVYDLSVMVGSAHVSTFGGGAINVALPYALKDGEDPRAIVVYWIDDLGKLQTVKGAYNTATGMAEFTTSHFSKYAVGYNKVMFSDVSGSAWYSGAVTFIAARGITTGTSNNCFDPDAPLTRGQFLVMLMRAYGISPDANSSNFSDAGNTYYTDYLAAAKQLGIAGGVGDNKFEPDKMITRQDMAVLLYRVLKAINELSVSANGQTVSSFSDADSVSSYALDAMNALVSGGIISGSSGKLDPLGYTSRAQMAQVLYNLLSKTF
ncbi:MAG: S-layer homology domain-containing protein, partial [Bacillota bacterium]|nr:S-layer homology domain-containing protein [Bacillota bacterium]